MGNLQQQQHQQQQQQQQHASQHHQQHQHQQHLFQHAARFHQHLNVNGLGGLIGNGEVGGIMGGAPSEDLEATLSKYVLRNKLDDQHEEWLRLQQEQQKRNHLNNGLNGLPQFINFNGMWAVESLVYLANF